MAFIVPEPCTPSFSSLLLGRDRRLLAGGTHARISWEGLVSQGAGPLDILDADARHVMAFVRDDADQPITWSAVRNTWKVDVAHLLSSRFGRTMTRECAAMFQITTADISPDDVDLSGWDFMRWGEVFNAVPHVYNTLSL